MTQRSSANKVRSPPIETYFDATFTATLALREKTYRPVIGIHNDFDENRGRAALHTLQTQTNATHEAMRESLIEAAKQMTPEQRALLKETLLRVPKGWKGPGRSPGGPPGPFQERLPA